MSRLWLAALSAVSVMSLATPGDALGAVDWPPSSGLVVGEVVTGGSVGADEYVELFNGGDAAVSLADVELVYATATGATVTRKYRWLDGQLAPGERVLVANVDGAYAGVADHAYSGGLSAKGGSIVVRGVGGDVIDALSWGSASSGFVEGAPGDAPPAGSSLERRPGDGNGNGRDTNDNAADTSINTSPVAQGRDGRPAPTPRPTPKPTPKTTPVPTPKPTPKPTPVPTPDPTAPPTPTPTPIPTPLPTPTVTTTPPTATPTLEPTQQPVPTPSPSPMPSAAPTTAPIPSMSPLPGVSSPPVTPAPTAPSSAMKIVTARSRALGADVTVSGTVTVQPGAVLGDRVLAIADDSGGIYVRLPSADAGRTLPRGTIVEVHGELAAPYGNLELRPGSAADISEIGTGGVPDPDDISSVAVAEANEGRLVSLTGTISEIDRGSSGSFSLTIRDDKGSARVFFHAALGVDRDVFSKEQRVRISGLVGQRASRSGAADGYRIWPRGPRDYEVLRGGEPGATPPPGEGPPKPPTLKRPRHKAIKNAEPGTSASIQGTVTSVAGFIDSDGRRVTVEDRTGAILVRYPADVPPAPVGSVIRAWGDVDTWFDTPQLETEVKPVVKRQARLAPRRLRRVPREDDEWRLVSVVVVIEAIERDGESWRAEGKLASGDTLPIAGLASSGISGELLEEGRGATITGIVRRAHPSATDQRFAIAPRSPDDIKLGRRPRGMGDASGTGDGTASDGAGAATAADVDGNGLTLLTANLASLEGLADVRVRVGGRLEQLDGRRLTLHDDSGTGLVRLHDDIGVIEPALKVGDVVNVAGQVRKRDPGPAEVLVRTAADVWRAATLELEAPLAATHPLAAYLGRAPVVFDEALPVEPMVTTWLMAAAGLVLVTLAGLSFAAAFWLVRRREQQPADASRPGSRPPGTLAPGAPAHSSAPLPGPPERPAPVTAGPLVRGRHGLPSQPPMVAPRRRLVTATDAALPSRHGPPLRVSTSAQPINPNPRSQGLPETRPTRLVVDSEPHERA